MNDLITLIQLLNALVSDQSAGTTQTHKFLNQFCIVRCRNAGVHAGVVTAAGEFVELVHSRRLWQWHSGFTLSEAAVSGIDPERSRIAVPVPYMAIPIRDVAEIIPCSPQAEASIKEAPNG